MSIRLENVSYIYGRNTSYEKKAIENVNIEIDKGEFIGLIGHTGSGKSTLIQHLNGLLKATSGSVTFNGQDIYSKRYKKRELRNNVGLVFQYPEQQLFAQTVIDDVCFGPLNQGLSEEEARKKAKGALDIFRMGEKFYGTSPADLSEGQKRKVAIAGVLAMEPRLMVLDEPTAGLDPVGRREILDPIRTLNRENGMAVMLASHIMEDIAEYTRRVIVMDGGHILLDGSTKDIFARDDNLKSIGLRSTEAICLIKELRVRDTQHDYSRCEGCVTVEEAVESLFSIYRTEERR